MLELQRCEKPAFAVIGKEGSTLDAEGFVQRLWQDANGHFDQVAHLAKRDAQGNLLGIWGAMTDFSRTFQPWEDGLTRGLYLAGVECPDDAEAPVGWTKWAIPGFEYLYTLSEGSQTLREGLAELETRGLFLAGAIQDFTCPKTGKDYLFFPIRRL